MIGIVESGLAETIEFILKRYSPEQQNRLVSNVFLTGGSAAFPGLRERLQRELREIRPFQSEFQVNIAENTSLDAWYGARDFALSGSLPEYLVSRKDYEEMGGEYLKVHSASNVYTPSPDPLPMTMLQQVPVAHQEQMVVEEPIDVEIE